MKLNTVHTTPKQNSYDVVIIGGANMGASVSCFLGQNKDFNGSILVVEKDTNFQFASTAASNDCIRQQFANGINIEIAQFGAEYIQNFREYLGGDPEVPNIPIRNFGNTQANLGAGTKMVTPDEIESKYPSFYKLSDIQAGSLNTQDEGYFDAPLMLRWQQKKAAETGTEMVQNEVMAINHSANKVESVVLKSGETINAGTVVNAAGPRARLVANMVGIEVPIEPRRRYTYIFSSDKPLAHDLPLTIDPTGVHFRQSGDNYLVGCPPMIGDPGVAYDDFRFEKGIWEEKLAPILANRIPNFDNLTVMDKWVGHYEFNTYDQNGIVGPHSQLENFIFVNGFSGHGTQQAPSMGRGVSELITYGEFRTQDLSQFSYSRLERNERLVERAVI